MARSKYKAKKTKVNGITFDSKKEADRYCELKMLQKGGIIKDLALQPNFLLQHGFEHDGEIHREIKYIADFMYWDEVKKETVVEDVKGYKTEVYRIKKKLFLKKYGDKYKFIET